MKGLRALKETAKNKPQIDRDARDRIPGFIKQIEKLQKEYAVEIWPQDGGITFTDMRRKDDWNGYGEWDAIIRDAEEPKRFRLKNLRFEEFEDWGR